MRATLDRLQSFYGLILAVVLLSAGAGLLYTASFIGGQVEQILGAEKINMPTEEAINADDGLSDEDKKAMMPYAGSEMDTGAEARAYANHYIYAHLMHSTGGETYSTLGPKVTEACGENRENADSEECQQLSGLRDTAQKASALRTGLLFAWMAGTMASVANIAGWIALALGLLMAVLAALGFRHAKKVERHRA